MTQRFRGQLVAAAYLCLSPGCTAVIDASSYSFSSEPATADAGDASSFDAAASDVDTHDGEMDARVVHDAEMDATDVHDAEMDATGNDANCDGTPNQGCECINGSTSTCGAVVPGLESCIAARPVTCAGSTWPRTSCTGSCNDCPTSACGNGSCVDDFNSYHCTCAMAFSVTPDGKACSTNDPCNGVMCPPNGGCHAGTCSCNPGFVMAANNTCVDACANVNCGVGGACSMGVCSCSAGYQLQNGVCVNVNDCAAGACANGSCVDGLNTYACTCNAGFDGTGTQACTNHNDCPLDACANGSCVDGLNTYNCTCNTGFDGTGTQACTNHDDCPPHACINGTCVDGINTFTCTCRAYSEPVGTQLCCPTKCAPEGGNSCDYVGFTIGPDNTASGSCLCVRPYQGWQGSCELPCDLMPNCGPNSTCTNSDTGAICGCLPGFVRGGTSCVPDLDAS